MDKFIEKCGADSTSGAYLSGNPQLLTMPLQLQTLDICALIVHRLIAREWLNFQLLMTRDPVTFSGSPQQNVIKLLPNNYQMRLTYGIVPYNLLLSGKHLN